jgi:glucosamine-6-phosphate deaminase
MSRKAANIISAQLILKPDSVLGLATGSSSVGIYRQLVDWYGKGDLDFSACRTVNLDEYVGLGRENTQSYAYFMYVHFFRHINIRMENTHLPDGTNNDTRVECERYNRKIEELGGVDLQLLGIGHNGHIGFNEPAPVFFKETHCVELTKETIEANRRFFGKIEDVPTRAYTMGIKNILDAKRIVLVAAGTDKAKILHRALSGPVDPTVPASILQMHNHVTVVADKDALSAAMNTADDNWQRGR